MIHRPLDTLLESINRVIVGKAPQIRLLVTALLARGHALLEDVPGMGKTLLAKALARSLAMRYLQPRAIYRRICCLRS